MITIHQSDAVKWANEYDGPLFHALLTDPPYHLTSIVKRFGKEGSAPAQFGRDGAFARASKGFMGKTWDGGDVAFDPATWAAFMRILHPGAFGMAFASSRGWHRLAVAIEDAGFIIHPTIFGWLYGSGFPKATRIDTQIDKMAGAERPVVGEGSDGSGRRNAGNQEKGYRPNVYSSGDLDKFPITAPATDLAKAWAGHRYGLQALKPALEPIIVFQKPYEGKPLDNMVETGAGALNIDSGRIPSDQPYTINTWDDGAHPFGDGAGNPFTGRQETGRWPANFILEDQGAAEALDAQSGPTGQLGPALTGDEPSAAGTGQVYAMRKRVAGAIPHDQPAGASRFFYRVQEMIDEADPVYYCSKASGQERDAGLSHGKVLKNAGKRTMSGGVDTRGRPERLVRNPHPTVKPIDLSRYLASLLLPPGMYAPRRIFVPFAGVASECIGAHQALWEEIVGIEMEEEYCTIARARAEYWQKKGVQLELFQQDS